MAPPRKNTLRKATRTMSPAENLEATTQVGEPSGSIDPQNPIGSETSIVQVDEDIVMETEPEDSDQEDLNSSILSDEESSTSSASNGDDQDEEMEDAPLEEQNLSPLGNQLPEVTTSLERQNNNPTVLDDSQSIEGIERSIALCDRRLTEYVIQIAKINETDPVLAKELREKQDIQMKDRRTFAALRASMIKGKDSSSWLSTKVPPAMPKLQWTTHSYDKSSEVFMDVGDALRKFKDVLVMHGLSPDYHWRRLVTGSLSSEHRAWLDELPSKPMTWNTFCEKYREAFGNDQEDEQQQAADELLEIQMGESEGLDHYIDRFMTLKRKAADLDSLMLTGRFVKGLIPALSQVVGMAISGWSRSRRSSLNRVIRITKRMKVNLPRGHTALGHNRRPESPSAGNGRANNMWQRYANDNARSNHGPGGNNNGCPFHEGDHLADRNHDPASCPEYNKTNKAFAKLNINKNGFGTKGNFKPRFTGKQLELFKEGLCVHCEKPFTRGHICPGGQVKKSLNNGNGNGNCGNYRLRYKLFNRIITKPNPLINHLCNKTIILSHHIFNSIIVAEINLLFNCTTNLT
ncbi:unnamed protein product [Mucor hiemalis]